MAKLTGEFMRLLVANEFEMEDKKKDEANTENKVAQR
jgi:hypothetical protein